MLLILARAAKNCRQWLLDHNDDLNGYDDDGYDDNGYDDDDYDDVDCNFD